MLGDSSDGRAVIGYRGRTDYQIKVRGQRLELGDIEMALAAVEGVTASVALLYRGLREPALTAVLEVGDVPAERAEQLVEAAREHCAQVLPDYMVPTLWHTLPALPVSPSGKADRKLLASLDLTPRLPTLRVRTACWSSSCAQLLRVCWVVSVSAWTRISFASGGHSLAALEVIAAVEEQLGLSVSIGALLRIRPCRRWRRPLRGSVARARSSRRFCRCENNLPRMTLPMPPRRCLFCRPRVVWAGAMWVPLASSGSTGRVCCAG